MEMIDKSGLTPEQIEYIAKLEKCEAELTHTIEAQKMHINNLMDILAKSQKTMFGRSCKNSRYVLGEDSNQLSLFNEAEQETNSTAEEPTVETIVKAHARKQKRTKEEFAETLPV